MNGPSLVELGVHSTSDKLYSNQHINCLCISLSVNPCMLTADLKDKAAVYFSFEVSDGSVIKASICALFTRERVY